MIKVKTKLFFFGYMIIITFILIACNSSPPIWADYVITDILEGTWVGNNQRTLIITGNRFMVIETNNPDNIRSRGTFTVNDPLNPTRIYFSNVRNIQACFLSGDMFILQDRPGGRRPNVAGGVYIRK